METEYRSSREAAYFAASNSRDGFCSYYESVFRSRVDRLYCIKGGPGTGKSTLMRRVAREGERQGWRAEYYYCSSDANSLDAVLLFGEGTSIGLLDATAPHAFEPKLPGVREEIIDLGQFWDSAVLCHRQEEIAKWNDAKSAGYRAAYHYLSAIGEVSDVLRDTVAPCLDEKKLCRVVRRLLGKGEEHEGQGQLQIGLCGAIGMKGSVRLDTYARLGERLCLIENEYDTAYLLLQRLTDAALLRGENVRVSYHPILPDRIDALFLRESKTVYLACESEEAELLALRHPHARIVHMRRLLNVEAVRTVRPRLRLSKGLRARLTEGAQEQFRAVERAHFALEEIYTTAMDFDAKEHYTEKLCRQLFGGAEV